MMMMISDNDYDIDNIEGDDGDGYDHNEVAENGDDDDEK